MAISKEVAAAAKAKKNLFGHIVTWDLGGAECAFTDVVKGLTDAGLEPEYAKELRPRSAFARACRSLREDRTIDRVNKEGVITHFQFTQKHLSETESKIEFDYECVVTLNNDTGELTCPESQTIEDHAKELFAHAMATRSGQDVTRLVQKLFEAKADLYAINPRKGVAYLVPIEHAPFAVKVETFIRGLGGKLERFPIPKGTPEGNRAVKDAINQGLTALVEELEEAVAGWDEKTKTSTMEKAFAKWEKAKYKVEAYGDYLQDEQANLTVKLKEAQSKLRIKVASLQPDDQTEE